MNQRIFVVSNFSSDGSMMGRVGVHPKIAAQAFGHLKQLPQQPQGFGIATPLAGVTFLELFQTAGIHCRYPDVSTFLYLSSKDVIIFESHSSNLGFWSVA